MRGPMGWSYLPASKIDKECSEIFVKTQNQLEFASNCIPVLAAIGASVCVPKQDLGRRKNFEIFFSEAETQKSKNRNNHLSFR